MSGQLLTVRHVADRLGLHPVTVLRWIRSGDLPAVRLSRGAIRIDEDQLDAWLRSKGTAPAREVRAAQTGTVREVVSAMRVVPPHVAATKDEE